MIEADDGKSGVTIRAVKWLSLVLFICSVAFSFSPGLLASVDYDGTRMYAREYQGTGADDDVCVLAGIVIFGSLLLVLVLCRLERFKALVVSYTALVFQLWFLHWIEVGSVRLTIYEDRNIALLLFVAVLCSVVPVSLVSLWLDIRRQKRAGLKSC